MTFSSWKDNEGSQSIALIKVIIVGWRKVSMDGATFLSSKHTIVLLLSTFYFYLLPSTPKRKGLIFANQPYHENRTIYTVSLIFLIVQ
jgi:hypothetical protein